MGSDLERTREPGIYKRVSTGKYVVHFWDPLTGRKRYSHPDMPRGGFVKLGDAKAFKRAREDEKKDRPSSRVSCDDYAKTWRTSTHLKGESTNRQSRGVIRRFADDFAGVFMDDVTRRLARLYVMGGQVPDDLERFAKGWKGTWREDGRLVAADHKAQYKPIRTMWNDAVDDEAVSRNPFAALGVEYGNGRRGVLMLTSGELDKLVESAAGEFGDYGRMMLGPMVRVAAGAGLRPGEQYAMRWDWVDFEAGEIHVKAQLQHRTGLETLPKGADLRIKRGLDPTRRVVMLPMVVAALRQARELRQVSDDHVFFTASGKPFRQRSHWVYWSRVRQAFWKALPDGRREEIDPGFDYYELRHWFGSHLAGLRGPHGEVLMSAEDIADQMGNSPEEAMKTYIHTPSENARERVRRALMQAEQRAAG